MEFEWGIAHRDDVPPNWRRVGMTEAQARGWLADWLADGGRLGVHFVVRRPLGEWEFVLV